MSDLAIVVMINVGTLALIQLQVILLFKERDRLEKRIEHIWHTFTMPSDFEPVLPIRPRYNWAGEGPEPPRWIASDGTHVYRSYADYCDG